jgi:hypothetical protein
VRDGGEILQALDSASAGVQAASTKLSRLISEFGEASIDEQGEIKEGTGLRYEVAIKDELAYLYTTALEEGRKPPAEDIRGALAERAVRSKQPQLYADYHAQKTQIEALKLWISSQKQVISGYQSLRRGEAT